jgi:hypothetical protein
MDKIDRVIVAFRKKIDEDVAIANSLSGGNIAGTSESGDEPPVKKRKRYIYPKDKKGYRTFWMQK